MNLAAEIYWRNLSWNLGNTMKDILTIELSANVHIIALVDSRALEHSSTKATKGVPFHMVYRNPHPQNLPLR